MSAAHACEFKGDCFREIAHFGATIEPHAVALLFQLYGYKPCMCTCVRQRRDSNKDPDIHEEHTSKDAVETKRQVVVSKHQPAEDHRDQAAQCGC